MHLHLIIIKYHSRQSGKRRRHNKAILYKNNFLQPSQYFFNLIFSCHRCEIKSNFFSVIPSDSLINKQNFLSYTFCKNVSHLWIKIQNEKENVEYVVCTEWSRVTLKNSQVLISFFRLTMRNTEHKKNINSFHILLFHALLLRLQLQHAYIKIALKWISHGIPEWFKIQFKLICFFFVFQMD